jgi:hypothetical protein
MPTLEVTSTPSSEAHDMIEGRSRKGASLQLRAGEMVQVRSRDEILQTLDRRGCLDGLPFMPEMLRYCGRQFRVRSVAHKTCDTIHSGGGRRMRNCVHLEDLRCDGADHGGCQAGCLIFWNEAWLKRAGSPETPSPRRSSGVRCTAADLYRATQAPGPVDAADPAYRCQVTDLLNATEPLPWWDLRQYISDVTSGNRTVRHMLRILSLGAFRAVVATGHGYRFLVGAYNRIQRWKGGQPYPDIPDRIPKGERTPTETLDLQPGELVQVKSHEEIRATTTSGGFNRGMRFDVEMVKYCGKTYRVQARVDKIINEKTGRMMHMQYPCILLDDVFCRAECTPMRLGCPRAVNTYWREIWLRRVGSPEAIR